MKKCFLCDISDDKVLTFENKTFKNCNLKLLFRKEKGFKYHDIQLLTKQSVEFLGYHTTCYKKITVLGQKYSELYLTFAEIYEVEDLSGNIQKGISKSSDGDIVDYIGNEDAKTTEHIRYSSPIVDKIGTTSNVKEEVEEETFSFVSTENTFEIDKSHDIDPVTIVWSNKLRKLNPRQRLLAEKAINDVLFQFELDNLDST